MTTTNLGLSTYDTTSGSATLFLTYRLAIAGNSSNMQIIDDWAGGVSGSIVVLEANSLKNVNASMITTNYYESTVSSITSYATNMMINLKLNATISGSTTLNINSLGAKELRKVDVDSTLVNLVSGDLRVNKYYLFIYNGTYFVMIGSNIADQISISGSVGNFVSISGSNVLVDSGVALLTGVSSGSYNKVQVDTSGRVTSGSVMSYLTSSTISGSSVMSTTTGSEVRHNVSGIASGSYNKVQVDIYGHVTGGSGIAAAISGSSVMSTTTGSEVRHNVSGVTSGSYNTVQVDIYGHVTAGSPVIRHTRKTVTTDYTITLNDEKIYSSGSIIVLPTAVGNFNDYYIKNIGGSNIIITSTSGSIDNLSSQTISVLDGIFVSSDNTNWWIL